MNCLEQNAHGETIANRLKKTHSRSFLRKHYYLHHSRRPMFRSMRLLDIFYYYLVMVLERR